MMMMCFHYHNSYLPAYHYDHVKSDWQENVSVVPKKKEVKKCDNYNDDFYFATFVPHKLIYKIYVA